MNFFQVFPGTRQVNSVRVKHAPVFSFFASEETSASEERQRNSFRYIVLAVLLMAVTIGVVIIYYYNHPHPEPSADTWSYLYGVERIQAHGQFVTFWRLPGYPLFILCIYAIAGQGNLAAVSAAQATLFVLGTLEIYLLAVLIFQRAWIAFLVGLMMGSNVVLLSYVKPLLSEGLGLWLCLSLVLATVLWIKTLRASALWLITGCLGLLFLTRPEWVYLPVTLSGYVLFVAAMRGQLRGVILHVLLSIGLFCAIVGGYIFVNATQNHFAGLTWIENINELGKVLQYNMQNEAPSQYAGVSHILDRYTSRGIIDPYVILDHEPKLASHAATLSGEFARTIIAHHPVEFLSKSLPVAFSSLTVFYTESPVASDGLGGHFLLWLQDVYRALYIWNGIFPLIGLFWLLLLCFKRTRGMVSVQAMGSVALICFYALIITTLGAYRGYDYMRIHILFDPLLTLLIWGTLLIGVEHYFKLLPLHHHASLSINLSGRIATCSPGKVPGALLVLLMVALLFNGGVLQRPQGVTNVVPMACHGEWGVGLLFITVTNQAHDADPSTTSITFKTSSSTQLFVRVLVQTPAIPSTEERLLVVELPSAPGITSFGTANFLHPVGRLTITTDASHVLPEGERMHTTLSTTCHDWT